MRAAKAVFEAISTHDLDALAKLLESGADPNVMEDTISRWRPLQAAIEALEDGGTIDAIVLLLRHGASVDARDGQGASTPLLMALFREKPDAARLLLVAGADPTAVGNEGDSPLRWCAERGWVAMAQLLLRCGAKATINEPGGPTGMNALGQAARRLDVEMVRVLMENGAAAAALDADRLTALERITVPPVSGDSTESETAAPRIAEIRRLLGGGP